MSRNIANRATCTSGLSHIAQPRRRTLADRRRQQLVALLYRHGGGMPMRELLAHPDAPPCVETILERNPDWFVVGRRNARLAWVESHAVSNARARRSGGGAA